VGAKLSPGEKREQVTENLIMREKKSGRSLGGVRARRLKGKLTLGAVINWGLAARNRRVRQEGVVVVHLRAMRSSLGRFYLGTGLRD